MSQFCVYYHTHWDREWYQPFRSYQVRLAEVVDEILERLEQDDLPCFMLDGQTIVLRDYLELRPENRGRLERLIQSGRLIIGPWLVMPDEFLVCGESLLRNLLFGVLESKAWGCQQFTGYLPDTFGHSADIPTLLQGMSIDSAVLWRGVSPPKSLFTWQAPSGASVITLHLTDGYLQISPNDWTLSRDQRIEGLKALAKKLVDAAPSSEFPVLIPAGGDHLGPTQPDARALLKEAFPNLRETTPVSMMEETASVRLQLQCITGELLDHQGAFLLPGVWSARLYLKQENRRLEHTLLHRLEPLLALVQSLSNQEFRYPVSELKLAWETLILNHPHDSICGCSIDEVHRENEIRFLQVHQLIDALHNRAIHQLSCAIPEIKQEGWVLNTSDHPYTGVALVTLDGPASENMPAESVPIVYTELQDEDWKALEAIQGKSRSQSNSFQLKQASEILQDNYLYDIHRIPQSHLSKNRYQAWVWVDKIPAYGMKLLPSASPIVLPNSVTPVKVTAQSISNEFLKIQITDQGEINVIDIRTKQSYPGLIRISLQADQGDSYNTAPVRALEFPQFKSASIIHTGPLHGDIQLHYSFSGPCSPMPWDIIIHFILEAGSPLLQIETIIESHPLTQHKVQLQFETGCPVEYVCAESHYSEVIRTYSPDYKAETHMPAARWKELKSNTGPIQRYISANGQSWITEGLTEYEVNSSQLGITLLRSFGDLSSNKTGVRGAQAGPIFKTPEGACQNRVLKSRMSWLLTPSESGELDRLSKNFYGAIRAFGPRPNPDETCPKNEKSSTSNPLSPPRGRDQGWGGELSSFSLIHWKEKGLIATACHWLSTEKNSGGLLLRLLNLTEKVITTQLRSDAPFTQVTSVNLLNEPIAKPQSFAQSITVESKQLQTFLIR